MLTNQTLIKKMEQERWELEQEKDLLIEDIAKEHLTQNEFDSVYNDFIDIIENPLAVWDLQDVDTKQLLIGVLFGGKIYYSKKGSFQTPQKSLSGDNNPVGRSTRIELATTGTTNLCSTNWAKADICLRIVEKNAQISRYFD